MNVGQRIPGPSVRPETPDVGRARRSDRLTRRRMAAQGGERVDQPTDSCSTSGQGIDDQQNTVVIDQDITQMKAQTQNAKKNNERSKAKLKKAEAQLDEKTKENENLLMTNGTLREELKTVKAQLGFMNKQNQILAEERDSVMREVEKVKMEKDELELETISISTTSFQESCTDYKKQIKNLKKSLETANNESVRGETTILLLEGEKEDLADELEKMKKEKKTISSSRLLKEEPLGQSRLDGDAMTAAGKQIKMLTEERDEAMREIENLKKELENTPSTSFQGSIADRKCKIRMLEKQLEELFSEVRSIAGLSENVPSVDSPLKLREAWHRHECRYQKLRDRVEGITERKRAAYANTQLLREAIEKLLEVEPGTMEITDLVEKMQDIEHFYALKIDNINAKLEAKQQSSKEKLQKIRDICRATATEMDIKFKKKTKIPEFLALFSSVWNKHQGLLTLLDKKLRESDCRIEELESASDQMKEELEQTTTSKEIKKKKNRLLRTVINTMVPKQTSDETVNKLKDQADQIRRLEAIQDSKYRQDHEVVALHRESNAIRQTNGDLQKKQKHLEEVVIDLNRRLDQEKHTVRELRQIIQIIEKGNRPGTEQDLQHNIEQHMPK